MLDAAARDDFPLGDLVAADARDVALGVLGGATAMDVIVIDRAGNIVGRAR
jgi:cobalt-precorrin-5B (C1)-methyltransferase